jgi:nucleotide-binding universal stress UspA family protein
VFHNIIVPVDGSAPSDAAIALALQVASAEGASVTFVHAIDPAKIAALAAPSSLDPTVAIQAAEEAATEILASAAAQVKPGRLTSSTQLLEGDPVSTVLDLAKERSADLIIVGSHGRGGLSRALLGSVAEGILRKSTIPVLVTHAPRPQAGH